MGRHIIYKTKEEKYEAEKRWKREWYQRNIDHVRKINLEYYHKNKNENTSVH
jgi:uncharacterized protein YijF (DUF1287 family)